MFKRMLVLSLLGVLTVGGAVAAFGTTPGTGPLTALAALVGGEGDGHDDDHDEDRDGDDWGHAHDD